MFKYTPQDKYIISQTIIADIMLNMIIKRSKKWKTQHSSIDLIVRDLDELIMLNNYRNTCENGNE